MKLFIIFALLFILSYSCFAQANYRDVVYLKNGSIVKGVIIEQVPNVSLKIETKDGSVFVYEMAQVEKIAKERIADNYSYLKSEKSPVGAFLLSFLFPGGGQYYNGEYVKGILQDLVYLGGVISIYANDGKGGTGLTFGVALMVGASLWSMIDAPISASRINDQLRQENANRYGHFIESKVSKSVVLGIDPRFCRDGFGASLKVHF
jgi:TM2 domain-containing membrane protein YozV